MKYENLIVYYGEGKTDVAFGRALLKGWNKHAVYIVQFLKTIWQHDEEFIKRLEPEIKRFCFKRAQKRYDELTEMEKKDERMVIKNALNFARKAMTTRECDLIVLDGFLGVVAQGIVTKEELTQFFNAKPESIELVLTGQVLPDIVREAASEIYFIDKVL